MRKRVLVASAAVACAFLALAGTAAGARPNVVLVVTDDQRWDTLSDMPTVQSQLVAKGVTFTNAFAVNPLCCPSRATILTGLYSHTTGIYNQNSFNPTQAQNFRRRTLANWLDDAGYTTAYVGKYLNGYDGSFVPGGWDRWTTFTGLPAYYDYTLLRDGTTVSFGSFADDYSTDVLGAEAADFIRETSGEIFLLFAPYAPHVEITGDPPPPAPRHAGTIVVDPWRPPSVGEDISDKPAWLRHAVRNLPPAASWNSDAVREGQLEALRAVDDAVARILDALTDTGRLADTLFVFTADNGLTWGEHSLGNWKLVPHEESIRVPFVVRFDGRVPAGRQSSRMVANVDIAPTAAEAAGVPRMTEGRSLLPLFAGVPVSWRRDLVVEHVGTLVPTYCAVRSRAWLYAQYADRSEELYRLATDPYQLQNLASRPVWGEIRHALRLRMRDLCLPRPRRFVAVDLCTRRGGDRREALVGTAWFDVLCPGRGRDSVQAKAGNDIVYARDRMRDVIGCGLGRDTVYADRRDSIGLDCEQVYLRQ